MRATLSVILICSATVPLTALCREMTLDEHFARSSVVFVGRATAKTGETPVDTATGMRPTGTRWYTVTTFAVEEMWKGSPERSITVRNCGASNGQWGFSCDDSGFMFQIGAQYLIFARGAPLETDRCQPIGATERPTARMQATLRWLADKPRIVSR